MPDKVLMGAIAGAHGVRGLVRIKSFAENDEDIVAYGALQDDAGSTYRLDLRGRAKGVLLASIEGVSSREAAEALKGTRLYVSREALPPAEEEEFYHADLIGLRVERLDGSEVGTVVEVQDFGAGDLIDVRLIGSRKTVLLPFDRRTVPVVDLEGGKLTIDPIPGLLEDGAEGDGDGAVG